jgi:hypothetical protein
MSPSADGFLPSSILRVIRNAGQENDSVYPYLKRQTALSPFKLSKEI